ncbi:B12-binding domain-containing radical SAM protein [bacterium]|nr:B12-binding domain-containing radical SAM protein [bacterium]
MKILLVSSSVTVFGFDRVTRLPNLGLCSIAGNYYCPDDEIKVLDLVVTKNPEKTFLATLLSFQPDVVDFSCMIFQFAEIVQLAGVVKNFNKDITTILGGYYATIDYDNILSYDGCDTLDFIIRNESETVFNELIRCVKSGIGFENISSLSYRDNGQIIHNPCSGVLDIDKLTLPKRSARIIKKGFHFLGIPADTVETSRGCPNNCKFCSILQMYGTTFRKFKIERVIADIQDAKNHGAKLILFTDDNITIDGKRYIEICDAIINSELNDIIYITQASVTGIKKTPGLAEKMAEAGVKFVFLGIENIVKENLSIAGKSKQNTQSDILEVVNDFRKCGVIVIGSFILGNPNDTEETMVANYKFANEINIDIPFFLLLTPFPKTKIREELLEAGLITNLSDYSKYDMFQANVKTHYLSSERLFELREEISYKILKKPSRILRLIILRPSFLLKLAIDHIIHHPGELLNYIKGMFW